MPTLSMDTMRLVWGEELPLPKPEPKAVAKPRQVPATAYSSVTARVKKRRQRKR